MELVSAVTVVLVVFVQIITAPVISQLIGRAAYRTGMVPPESLVVDELAAGLPDGEVPRRADGTGDRRAS